MLAKQRKFCDFFEAKGQRISGIHFPAFCSSFSPYRRKGYCRQSGLLEKPLEFLLAFGPILRRPILCKKKILRSKSSTGFLKKYNYSNKLLIHFYFNRQIISYTNFFAILNTRIPFCLDGFQNANRLIS